jgi:hypothetical protein
VKVAQGTVVAVALVVAAVISCEASAAIGSTIVRETAASGGWTADFTYVHNGSAFPSNSSLHLTVLDGSRLVLDEPVISHLRGVDDVQPGGYGGHKSVSFRELDGGGQPELLLSLFTGGAHCCFIQQVFDLVKSPPRKTEFDFGDGGATIETVDGKTIFRAADDSFDYAFTDYADSASPIQIWGYSADRFHNLTRSFPKLIASDAASWWKWYRSRVKSKSDERGVLGAWAADEALLGHAAQAEQTLLQVAFAGRLDWGFGGAKGSSYVRQLWRFLSKQGYLR